LSYYGLHEKISVIILCITAPVTALIPALGIWEVWEIGVTAAVLAAVFVAVGYFSYLSIEKRLGNTVFVFASSLLAAAATAALVILADITWWQIIITSAMIASLISMVMIIVASKSG